ncbi:MULTISPECIES: methionine ABC transporter ATP-binding protein [Blautia]|jgi:ABC-type methionine transport system ATPase subunit|uniref:methionine ABC transporter ATP-binding protein n=1 Tax=Blautia TaxID=572511 RepID=UPI000E50937D|nr:MULTISPECIES: ATP-binding cassette domain-containing protein [Blautia]NSG20618.1 ATP-binding cassette domain-containing protein [Blautia obeum]RGG59038.1 ATP-binding cassette domain-containing protein [Blautia sp. AF19-10LB]
MEPMIQVENLCKRFNTKGGTVEAAKNISFSIEKGEIFGIIGLSGAGKSTLVRCLNLLERPTSGTVRVNGKNLTELSEKELRKERQKIGMIFQHFNLLMQRTALDNVCFPMEIAGIKKAEARKKALEYLKIVGLEEKALSYPSQLSGGQKQRVAIARVLASDPQILLCDEATSALDPQTTKAILELIKEINRDYGITVVVITHEMSVVQEICDKVAVLERGALVEIGTVEELFRNPKTDEAKKLVFSGRTQIQEMKGKRLVRVTFQEKSSFEPVIANLVLTYRTPVNILYADTKNINGQAQGEMILQLPEIEEVANKMIQYLRDINMGVEEVSSDVG